MLERHWAPGLLQAMSAVSLQNVCKPLYGGFVFPCRMLPKSVQANST